MRSPLGTLARAIRNGPPVSFASSRFAGVFSGQRQNTDGQLGMMEAVSTVFGIVSRLSNSTARVEWHLYRSALSGLDEDRVEVTSHAALDVWNTPNDFFTRQDVVETGQQHVELAGKSFLVVARTTKFKRGTALGDLPLELWPVRPDRIAPVPDPRNFLVGWMYSSPDGEQVPLRLDDVIQLRTPHPRNPYDGLSPVTSLMTDLDAARYSAMWNRNFFLNGAEPGGMLKSDRRLSDDEFDEIVTRWREQHQGVANAHRVAILEQMEWVDRKVTQRDMQFVDLRNISREMIREAWGIPKFALGIIDDVNRATAEASSNWFGKELSEPRLDRWKAALNTRYLPMFGATAAGLEFDYERVVSEDREADNADMTAKVTAAKTLIELGFDRAAVLQVVGLSDIAIATTPETDPEPTAPTEPAEDGEALAARALTEMVQKIYLGVDTVLTWEEARGILNRGGAGLDLTVPPPEAPQPTSPFAPEAPDEAPPGGQDEDQAPAEENPDDGTTVVFDFHTTGTDLDKRITELLRAVLGRPRNADDPPDDPEAVEAIDLSGVQEDWETALNALMATWSAVVIAEWISDLVEQIAEVLRSGLLIGLTQLRLSTEDAVRHVVDAMVELAEAAARHVVTEADKQDTEVKPVWPKRDELEDSATVTVDLLAQGIRVSAAREAQRRNSPGVDANEVAGQVGEFLEGLSTAEPAKQLGGALTEAQNAGRIATLRAAPAGALYASEVNDRNSCGPCKAIHGRWIANTDDMAAVWKLYPGAGYIDCKGGIRCRGTIVGVWRPKTTEDGEG